MRQSESQLSLMPMCAYEPQRMRNLCEFDSPLSSMIRRMMKAGARGEGRCWCFSDRILCSWKLEVCVDWVPLCLWVWTEPNHRISNLFQDKGTFSVPPGSFALWLVGRNLRDDSGRLILRCCSAHGRLMSGGDGNAGSPFYFCLDGLLLRCLAIGTVV